MSAERVAPEQVATKLVSEFDRMVRRDGGSIALVGVTDSTIRVAYRPGRDLECEGDVCVLPHHELATLMSETLARRAPQLRVVVDLAT